MIYKYNIRLNPKKCTIKVKTNKFLKFMLIKRRIEVNPTKCQAIINMKISTNIREMQALNDRLVTLTEFISRSIDNRAPFFNFLKNNRTFEWTDKCEETFKKLEEYLKTPPTLTRLESGEILYIYLITSNIVMSFVLLKEVGDLQKSIYFIS